MICNIDYAVDEFHLNQDDAGIWRLRCRGWIHAQTRFTPVQRYSTHLRLVVPGDPPSEFPITEFDQPSEDVASLLGPGAASVRFRLDSPVTDMSLCLEESRIVARFAHGDGVSIGVGHLLTGRPIDPAVRALIGRFESIGNNCELGLLQRDLGFERMGLFRFAASKDTPALTAAIADGLHLIGTSDDLDVFIRGEEWIAASRRYGLEIHTWRTRAETSEAQIRDIMSTTLRYQADLFTELMEGGERIFVRRARQTDDLTGIEALHTALRSHGPAVLLWVTDPQGDEPHGTITRLGEGFYRGAHRWLNETHWPAPSNRQGWLSLLAAAAATIDADQARSRPRPNAPLLSKITRLLSRRRVTV